MQKKLQKFREQIIIIGYSINTCKLYISTINRIVNKVNNINDKNEINRFLSDLKTKSTRNIYIAVLNFFYKSNNINIKLAYNKVQKKEKNIISKTEMLNILNDSLKKYKKDLIQNDFRDHIILHILYSTAIRVSELQNLKFCDFNFNNKNLLIVKGKGNKERLVPYDSKLFKKIQIFQKTTMKKINEKIFDIKINTIQKIVLKYTNYYPHVIRHTCASHLADNGCDISVISEILGHSNLETTNIYLHTNFNKLANKIESHPFSQVELCS